MFKNCFALTKILLKSLFDSGISTSNAKKKKRKSSKSSQLLVAAIILVIFLDIPFFLSGLGLGVIIKQQDPTIMGSMWNMFLPISMILILLLSMISIVSVFFFSMDNSALLPLPLKSWEILVARFISSLGFVYFMEILFVAPLILGMSLGFDLSVIQFITSLFVIIALPIFPVSLCAVIFTFLSRVINFSKHKGAFTYISLFLAIGISLTISLSSSSLGNMGVDQDFSAIFDMIRNSENIFIKIFFFLIPSANALTSSNVGIKLLNILLILVINAAFVAIFVLICQKPYYKTLRESNNNGGKKKKITKHEINKETKSSSVFGSLINTEWKSIVRSPSFFSNTILAVIMIPIILILVFAITLEVEGGSQGIGFATLIQDLQNLSINNSMVLLAISCITLFLCSMNMTSSSAISRMGKSAGFVRSIPVRASTIVYSKLFIGTILGILVSLFFLIFIAVLGIINIVDTVLLFILLSSLNLLDNNIGLIFDLRKPNLNWDNENYAVKNNLNTLWGMLLSFVVIAIIVVLCIIFMAVENGGYIAYAISLIASILGNYLFHRYYSKSSKEVFKAI